MKDRQGNEVKAVTLLVKESDDPGGILYEVIQEYLQRFGIILVDEDEIEDEDF